MNPRNKTTNEAQKQNPALEKLEAFVGEWKTTGTHPQVPGKTFHGRASFMWIEDGAFLMLRTEIDEPEIPSGISIFGSDNVEGTCFILYFDERGISRKYDVSFENGTMKWSRNSAEFSQRMTLTMSADQKTIISKGEMSKNGAAWEPDLALTYVRVI